MLFRSHRLIRPFSALEIRCVDKQSAKEEAKRLAPAVKVAETRAVLALGPETKLKDAEAFLAPFGGGPFVAKPTHGSGGLLFLDELPSRGKERILELLMTAQKNYFFKRFEAQYRKLAPKLLVETSIGRPSPPDFRFFASRGKVFFCQYDEGGQGGIHQAFFTVPGREPIPLPSLFPKPDPLPPKPTHWGEMIAIAAQLSKPFDFVRVDLYDRPDGVYFGEFTFTPNAGDLVFKDPAFSRRLLADLWANLGPAPGA